MIVLIRAPIISLLSIPDEESKRCVLFKPFDSPYSGRVCREGIRAHGWMLSFLLSSSIAAYFSRTLGTTVRKIRRSSLSTYPSESDLEVEDGKTVDVVPLHLTYDEGRQQISVDVMLTR